MRRSPIALLILLALGAVTLYSSGVISWTPAPWEQHAAQTVAKDAGRAAKSIGVTIHDPPQPPGITPAPSTPQTTQAPGTPKATTQSRSQVQNLTTLYPTPSGQAITAPTTQESVTQAYCALAQVSAATCAQAEAQAQP